MCKQKYSELSEFNNQPLLQTDYTSFGSRFRVGYTITKQFTGILYTVYEKIYEINLVGGDLKSYQTHSSSYLDVGRIN